MFIKLYSKSFSRVFHSLKRFYSVCQCFSSGRMNKLILNFVFQDSRFMETPKWMTCAFIFIVIVQGSPDLKYSKENHISQVFYLLPKINT